MTEQRDQATAGEDWERLASQRRSGVGDGAAELAVPGGFTATAGRAQVTLDWAPVAGAAGYLVRRADHPDGPYEPLEIGEPWVRPVPHPPLADTTGTPGLAAWYTVAGVAAVDDRSQPQTDPIEATPTTGDGEGDGACSIVVDAAQVTGTLHRPWRPMIGAERLCQLDAGAGPGGSDIGAEFGAALGLAHDELGVAGVRSHAILHDDVGVYREVDGEPIHDFTNVDRIYDRVLALGLRPVVEVSFMPHDLAADPSKRVFHYDAIVSPPHDWDRWARLVGDLAAHLVERYGLEEVRTWGFEIWNEANLEVFWSGTRDEYFRLYDVAVRAIKAVDAGLLVGGPATAAVGWIDETFEAVASADSPLDFISTHTYGNAPLDLRPIAARYGRPDVKIWWTEWGAHATHFNRVHDSAWSAAYLARGMVSAMGRIDALAYWTVSDHFEELGRPKELMHGGFGLLAVGNLRKPRWWAQWMLDQLADERLAVTAHGDGVGDLVGTVATRMGDGAISIVMWNGTVDVSKSGGDDVLNRTVALTVGGLARERYRVRHRRVDDTHSNIANVWADLRDGAAWPDPEQWERLHEADELADLEPTSVVAATDGQVDLAFDLPMPSVSLIEMTPA